MIHPYPRSITAAASLLGRGVVLAVRLAVGL